MKSGEFRPFLSLCLIFIFSLILFLSETSCAGKIKLKKKLKMFLPDYMRSVYINDFINNSSEERTIDLKIRKILLDHYSSFHYAKKVATFEAKPHHSDAKLILRIYLNEIKKKEQKNIIVTNIDIDLKISKTEKYLLRGEDLTIETPLQENNLANAISQKLIQVLDHYMKNGVFITKI